MIPTNMPLHGEIAACLSSEARAKLFEGIVDASPDMVFVLDLRTASLVFVNAQIKDQLGVTPEESIELGPRFPRTVLDPAEIDAFHKDLATMADMLPDHVFDHVYSFRSTVGETVRIRIRATPFSFDGAGNVTHVVGIGHDVTRWERVDAEIADREASWLHVFEHLGQGVFEADLGTRSLSLSPGCLAILGYPSDTEHPRDMFAMGKFLHPDDLKVSRTAYRALLKGNTIGPIEWRFLAADGSYRWLQTNLRITEHTPLGAPKRIAGVHTDIDRVKRSEDQAKEGELRMRRLLDDAPALVWMSNSESLCDYLNAAWYDFTGLRPGDALGLDWAKVVHPDDLNMLSLQSMNALTANQEMRFEFRLLHHQGDFRVMACHAVPRDRDVYRGHIGILHDVTEHRRKHDALNEFAMMAAIQRDELLTVNNQLAALAVTDGLTGLSNHRAFQEELTIRIDTAASLDRPLSLVLLDLDHFKQFNDMHGHPAGDQLLHAIARLLQAAVDPVDVVARYGGEEFAIILLGATELDARDVCLRIGDALESLSHKESKVSASMGIASLRRGEDRPSLIERADQALYEAKNRGRNQITVAP